MCLRKKKVKFLLKLFTKSLQGVGQRPTVFSASEAQGGEANLPVEGLTGNPQEGVPQIGKPLLAKFKENFVEKT